MQPLCSIRKPPRRLRASFIAPLTWTRYADIMQTHAAATIDCSDCQCQPNYVYRLISDQSSSPSVVTLARPQSLNAWSWNMKMASVEIGLRSLELKGGFGPLPPPPFPYRNLSLALLCYCVKFGSSALLMDKMEWITSLLGQLSVKIWLWETSSLAKDAAVS